MTLQEVYKNRSLVNDYVGKLVIYKLTNSINNKVYVGITGRIKKRIYEHNLYSLNCHKLSKYLHKAIKKYGPDKFLFKIIDISTSNAELNEQEVYYIKKFDSANPKYGYNLAFGGNRGIPNEATTLKKIESSHKQKVAQYDLSGNLIKEYNSINEATRETGLPFGQISRSDKKNWTTGGFMFRRFEDTPEVKISPFVSGRGINFSVKGRPAPNKIKCRLINKKTEQVVCEAGSIFELAKNSGLDRGTIFRAISNENHKKWKVVKIGIDIL